MGNRTFCTGPLRALLALVLSLSGAAAYAQAINVTAANASNDAIYSVTFANGTGSISILNTDGGSLHNLTSLVFLTNPGTFQLDLLAADNGGTIVRYPGDFHPGSPTRGTVVFNGGTGPANPDGLSVDPAANLFVVNSKPGNASNPQLWVFPANGIGGFGTPVQIDANYGAGETLMDTLVVSASITPPGGAQPVLNPGDLLVLTSNPGAVLVYPGSNGNGPTGPETPATLLTLPVGTIPGGLAFWPPDNSLLITTTRGTILQYHLTPNETPANFATGLGNGQFKVKTGVQFGVPFAYVANNNGGDILQFGGPNNLLATVTSGVQHPQGLAITNVAYAAGTTCQNQQTGGCDLLGGRVLVHNVPPTLSLNGNVVENVCLVQVDPRLVNGGSCTSALPVASVCGGFSTSAVIPATLCGASGPTGKGFALVKTLSQAYATPGSFPFNGSLIFNDSNLGNVLPPSPTNPVCNPPSAGVTPLDTLVWAPLAGEGIVAEGNNMVELTSGCDGGASKSYGLSLFGLGLGLNVNGSAGLVSYTAAKYTTLSATITGQLGEQPIPVLPAPIPPAVQPPDGNFTFQLQQCIATSAGAFNKGSAFYDGAARELLAADQQVAAVAALAAPFTADADYPNPSGALRTRLQNMYYTINTRINGNQAASSPPSPPPAPPPPSIGGTPSTTAKAGKPYTFTPSAADFASNTASLSFSITGKPSWATFSNTTGQLSGTATPKGTYPNIVITVTDGCASASLPAFSIKVN